MKLKSPLPLGATLLSMAIGAVLMTWLMAASQPKAWGAYYVVASAACGAVIGRYLCSCAIGLAIALRGGAAMRVLRWAVLGAAVGAIMGVLAWRDASGNPGLPPALISGSAFHAALRCGIAMALLAALGVGHDFIPRRKNPSRQSDASIQRRRENPDSSAVS